MADEIENGALSQDALDALMSAVDNTDEGFSMDVEGSGAVESPTVETPEVDVTEVENSAVEQAEPPAPAPTPSHTPLHMASFDSKPAMPSSGPLSGFERVNDIPLELTVELGRTRLLIKDVLELGTGSIIELEKMAGEPVDLLANGLLIARGEVVVIEDNFGIRVTEVITSADRAALADDPINQNVA